MTDDDSWGVNEKTTPRMETFSRLVEDIMPGLSEGHGFVLSDIRDRANSMLEESERLFTNKELRVLLANQFGTNISFSSPQEANK